MSWILDLLSILLSICRLYIYIYIYICSADNAELPVLLYLLQCLVYHMLSKMTSSGNLHRVIGEVLVLRLLLVVYKIPYSSCM